MEKTTLRRYNDLDCWSVMVKLSAYMSGRWYLPRGEVDGDGVYPDFRSFCRCATQASTRHLVDIATHCRHYYAGSFATAVANELQYT